MLYLGWLLTHTIKNTNIVRNNGIENWFLSADILKIYASL